jgi:hypothetical protein
MAALEKSGASRVEGINGELMCRLVVKGGVTLRVALPSAKSHAGNRGG